MVSSRSIPTIIDVARLAGSSRSTVSRFLNDPSLVSAETRVRIESAIASLGYVPSASARAFKAGKSKTITMLVGDLTQPLIGQLAQRIARDARHRGLQLSLTEHSRKPELVPEILDHLDPNNCLGLIIATASDIDTPEVRTALQRLQQRGVRAISAIQFLPGTTVGAITQDYRGIANHATRWAIQTGGPQVALAAPNTAGPYTGPLLQGYRDAIASHPQHHDHVVTVGYTPEHLSDGLIDSLHHAGIKTLLLPGTLQAIAVARLLDQRRDRSISLICLEKTRLLELVLPNMPCYAMDLYAFSDALLSKVLGDGRENDHQFVPFVDPQGRTHFPTRS